MLSLKTHQEEAAPSAAQVCLISFFCSFTLILANEAPRVFCMVGRCVLSPNSQPIKALVPRRQCLTAVCLPQTLENHTCVKEQEHNNGLSFLPRQWTSSISHTPGSKGEEKGLNFGPNRPVSKLLVDGFPRCFLTVSSEVYKVNISVQEASLSVLINAQ